jgi:hypothetical protein
VKKAQVTRRLAVNLSMILHRQQKAMLISIENLLEDEQGLSMGEMLTVNFRQPRVLVIHWFRL